MSEHEVRIELKDLVRQARERLGLTQVEFADAVDMSQRWVSDLERGVIQTPRRDTMRRMADVLKLDVADIVIAAGQAQSKSGAERVANADFEIVHTGRTEVIVQLETGPSIEKRTQEAIRLLRQIDLKYDNRIRILEQMLGTWREMDILRQGEEESS